MLFVGKEFDADERAEVCGGHRLRKLDDVWDSAAELLEGRLGVPENGTSKFLPVGDQEA
jgi:hypothetical protein